jgi:hypothetical protein
VDRVKEANAERLRHEFTELRFKPGEGVEDFSLRVIALAHQLRILGEDITDKEVVKKVLHSMPEKLEHVAISMETLLDLNALSIKEATSYLLAAEQRKKKGATPVSDAEGWLLLTEEEWAAHMKFKENGGSSRGSNTGGGGERGRDRGRGRGHGRRGDGASQTSRDDTMACGACHTCGKVGHYACDCRSKKKQGEAHVAQDEEASLLLMVSGVADSEPVAPPPPTALS